MDLKIIIGEVGLMYKCFVCSENLLRPVLSKLLISDNKIVLKNLIVDSFHGREFILLTQGCARFQRMVIRKKEKKLSQSMLAASNFWWRNPRNLLLFQPRVNPLATHWPCLITISENVTLKHSLLLNLKECQDKWHGTQSEDLAIKVRINYV